MSKSQLLRMLDEAVSEQNITAVKSLITDIKYFDAMFPPVILTTNCIECGKELIQKNRKQTLHEECYYIRAKRYGKKQN